MKNKMKEVLSSEKGMSLVNLLFVLSMMIRSRGIIFVACGVWIVYLGYSMKNASSKAAKVINGIFIVFAAFLFGMNFYFMVKYW